MFSILSTISHPILPSDFVRGRPAIPASLMVTSGLSFYSATTRITCVNPDDEAPWTAMAGGSPAPRRGHRRRRRRAIMVSRGHKFNPLSALERFYSRFWT
jgi:hypothetical protein